MKISLADIDLTQFMVHQHYIGGYECFLVQPVHIGAVWSEENLIFRSSLWTAGGEPVSLSFKKFFNYDEKPDINPAPNTLKGVKLIEKMDGSTILISRFRGHTVIRTRGTVDAYKQKNGYEIDFLKNKYKKFFEFVESFYTTDRTFVLEWLSPTNRIVIKYEDEPEMVLTATILHKDYSLLSQEVLDTFAQYHKLKRPRAFLYDSIEEMKTSVEALRDQEGLCVYYENDQQIRKVKSAHYLACHRMKSEVSSLDRVVDLWFTCNQPSYEDFFKFISDTFDYEIAVMAQVHIAQVCEARKEVDAIVSGFRTFVETIKGLSRKEAAEKISQVYGNTRRTSYVFSILDNKPLDSDKLKKLTHQVLELTT
jgi:hypothetical protein